ncbi:MAG: hypothetical protein GY940_23260 [bacterium]|nr:hypothetical protein [bacterium]
MTDKLNVFLNNLNGIIKTPGETLGRLMEDKNWVPVFLLLMLTVGLLFFLIIAPVQMQKMAEDPQFAELMGDDRAGGLINQSTFSRVLGTFMALFGLFLSLVVGAFFVYLFFGIGGSKGGYGNYFALVTNASVIDILFTYVLMALSIVINFNISGLATPLTLVLAPEPTSMAYLVLARFNILAVWYLVAIAAGISVFTGMKFKKALMISVFYFLFKAVIGVSFSYLALKVSQSMVA